MKKQTPKHETSMTREEWERKGIELFGSDRENWGFLCPRCGNQMSIARAKREFQELKGSGWRPERECIGRYIDVPSAQIKEGKKSRPCDWAAYGLIGGPLKVKDGDKSYLMFNFADDKP